jgi:hypothetical protein
MQHEITPSVRTSEELMSTIGPDRTIILEPGTYTLSSLPQYYSEHVIWQEVFDGEQLVIDGIENLQIIGNSEKPVKILVTPRYAYVLSFINCKNITFKNIEFGHTNGKGYCTGGVLSFKNCSDINIENSVLHGSGHEGLTLSNVKGLKFNNSVIRDCTYSIMSLSDSSEILFTNSEFFNNEEFDMVKILHCYTVNFLNCNIHDNKAGCGKDYSHYPLFKVISSSDVMISKTKIHNNVCEYLLHREGTITLEECEIENNTFLKSQYRYGSKKLDKMSK